MGGIRLSASLRIPGATGDDRAALLAGLEFVEGVAAGWGRDELGEWILDGLVGPGRMARPRFVSEAVVGTIALEPDLVGLSFGRSEELPKLLAMARSRVVATLRALVTAPGDDRFLHSAIFHERVQRIKAERGSVWVARPVERDHLSDIVLSLFAVDILMHRELHERTLCVCGVCGRVSFAPAVTGHEGCSEHLPRGEGNSGFRRSDPKRG